MKGNRGKRDLVRVSASLGFRDGGKADRHRDRGRWRETM